MKKIKLTKNQFVLVDDEDYERVNQFKWCLNGVNYAHRRKPNSKTGETILMHRFILNTPKGKLTDHINYNTLDNRKCNLRIVTKSQNQMNLKPYKNKSSKYKGVSYYKANNNWEVYIKFNNKTYHLGRYKTESEAAIKYNEKAKELFGKFAYLNEV